MILENYLQSIQEGTIFSDKILVHNPELLHKSKIFVVGLSGSGKSTLGKYLAEEYNIEYIELDDWYWNIASDMTGKSFEELIRDKSFDTKSVNKEMEKRAKNYKGSVVFDGVHSMWMDRNLTLSNCVIMMGTSTLLSSYRAFMRNKDEEWSKKMTIIQILKDVYYNQKQFIKNTKEMRDEILKRNNYKTIDSKEDLSVKKLSKTPTITFPKVEWNDVRKRLDAGEEITTTRNSCGKNKKVFKPDQKYKTEWNDTIIITDVKYFDDPKKIPTWNEMDRTMQTSIQYGIKICGTSNLAWVHLKKD